MSKFTNDPNLIWFIYALFSPPLCVSVPATRKMRLHYRDQLFSVPCENNRRYSESNKGRKK
jgi:hypothetical protein